MRQRAAQKIGRDVSIVNITTDPVLERQMMRLKGVKSGFSQLLQDNINKLAAARNT